MFTTLFNFFRGRKTYLVSIATFVYGGGIAAGWWPHIPSVDLFLASAGAATLRAAIAKGS